MSCSVYTLLMCTDKQKASINIICIKVALRLPLWRHLLSDLRACNKKAINERRALVLSSCQWYLLCIIMICVFIFVSINVHLYKQGKLISHPLWQSTCHFQFQLREIDDARDTTFLPGPCQHNKKFACVFLPCAVPLFYIGGEMYVPVKEIL